LSPTPTSTRVVLSPAQGRLNGPHQMSRLRRGSRLHVARMPRLRPLPLLRRSARLEARTRRANGMRRLRRPLLLGLRSLPCLRGGPILRNGAAHLRLPRQQEKVHTVEDNCGLHRRGAGGCLVKLLAMASCGGLCLTRKPYPKLQRIRPAAKLCARIDEAGLPRSGLLEQRDPADPPCGGPLIFGVSRFETYTCPLAM
jgi:hypothetical protein